MSRQPHPELNFSRGRAMRFDARAFVKACRLLGMTDAEIVEAVKKMSDGQTKTTPIAKTAGSGNKENE